MSEVLFLPVKPKWAELIVTGKKTLELRKRAPSKGLGKRFLIYASSPRREVVGTCTLTQLFTIYRDRYTLALYDRALVANREFCQYIGNADHVYGLGLLDPRMFLNPIPLAVLRDEHGIEPPQQWRYISKETFDAIVRAGQ